MDYGCLWLHPVGAPQRPLALPSQPEARRPMMHDARIAHPSTKQIQKKQGSSSGASHRRQGTRAQTRKATSIPNVGMQRHIWIIKNAARVQATFKRSARIQIVAQEMTLPTRHSTNPSLIISRSPQDAGRFLKLNPS
eukprot:scaffold171372_cov30-Tisochrysis_lutea.AAC.2